jgi:hypothetical protein
MLIITAQYKSIVAAVTGLAGRKIILHNFYDNASLLINT